MTNPAGCDSTFILHLTVNNSTVTDLNIEACEEYTWYGTTYDQSGVYEHLLQSQQGCDSLLMLHLTIGEAFSQEETITACDEYTWHGTTYNQSGTFTYFVANPSGCDSTFILHLTVNPSYTTVIDSTANSNSFDWYGQTYTESGTYEYLLQSATGCDSLLILNLKLCETMVYPVEEVLTCQLDYEWHGHTYIEDGTYHDTIIGETGCEEIYVLQLRFVEEFSVELNDTVCDSYPWPWASGGYLTESGFYTQTVVTEAGCDSIVKLNLTVNRTPVINVQGPTQVAAATNIISGIYIYYVTDTEAVDPNTLEWVCSNPDWIVTPLDEGYRCRLVVTTIGDGALKAITHNSTGCDTSAGIDIHATYFDVEENEVAEIYLFPNPAKTNVTIQAEDITQIQMIDAIGQVLLDQGYGAPDTVMLDISKLPPALYVIKVASKAGTTTHRLIIAR